MAVSDRLAVCLKEMEKNGLDMLVGLGGSLHNFLFCESILVTTGFRTIGPSAAVVDRNGSVRLFVSPSWDAKRARRETSGVDVVATDDLPAALAKAGLAGKRLGVANLAALPYALTSRLEPLFGANFFPADELIRLCDKVRFPDEVEDIRTATAIAEKGYQRLLEIVRPGMREYELVAELFCYCKQLGAEDNFLLLACSLDNVSVGSYGNRVITEGDIIITELTPSINWQFSQVCRTVSIGEPNDTVREKYEILRRSMKAGMAAAKPGTSVKHTTDVMNAVFADAGYGDYCRPPYMRVRGHGLGSLSNLPGDIDSNNEWDFEEGMVFVMHPNQYIPGAGYMMCGGPVRIGKNGAEVLSSSIGELDVVRI